MNFLKRAITSIKRRPAKSLILLLLVLILGTVISGAIAVDGAVNRTDANLRRGMRPIISFDLDEEALMREMEVSGEERFDLMTLDMVRAIGGLPYVEQYDYSLFSELLSSELESYGSHGGYFIMNGEHIRQSWFTIRGTSQAEPLDMREGLIELSAGTTFTDAHLTQASEVFPVIISTGLAQTNHLNIGSTFRIERTFYRPIMGEDWDRERTEEDIFAQRTFEFEVVGLIDALIPEHMDINDPEQEWQIRNLIYDANNRFYLPNIAAEIIQRFEIDNQLALEALYWDAPEDPFGENPQLFQTVMMLYDIDDLETFRQTAEGIIPAMWYVTDLTGTFSEITSSMNSLQDIASWILIVSIGATLLILSLLITLFLKDRRHEIGVYLALGEKKIKIIIQIVIEVSLIAVVAITLALFTGHFISTNLSTTMIRNELMAPADYDHWGNWGGAGVNALAELGLDEATLTIDEMIAAFDVSLELATIGLFFAIGIGAVILSTLIPVVYIVTLKPKKVLL